MLIKPWNLGCEGLGGAGVTMQEATEDLPGEVIMGWGGGRSRHEVGRDRVGPCELGEGATGF